MEAESAAEPAQPTDLPSTDPEPIPAEGSGSPAPASPDEEAKAEQEAGPANTSDDMPKQREPSPATPEWADFQAAQSGNAIETDEVEGSVGVEVETPGDSTNETATNNNAPSTPSSSPTVANENSEATASSGPVVVGVNVEIPVRSTSLQPDRPNSASGSRAAKLGRQGKTPSPVNAETPSSAKPSVTKKAKELFALNKFMLGELEQQEKFAAGKIRDWSRIHADVQRRLAMARRDHAKLMKIAAGAELPPSPVTARAARGLERGAAVFARWPLGGERDLGDLGDRDGDSDTHWHFGIFLGLDPFSEELARIKFLFPAAASKASEAAKASAAAEAAARRASSAQASTAYPAQVAKLAPLNNGGSSASGQVQALEFPGRNIRADETEDRFSWILDIPLSDVVEVSYLRPGDRILFYEGAMSSRVTRELRKGSAETLSSMPSSSSLFDPASTALGFAFSPITPEERVLAERPALAFAPYIIAAPVNIKSRVEEPVANPDPAPAAAEPGKKGKKGTPAAPEAVVLVPPKPPSSEPSAIYHIPLTVIPEERYNEYEAALNEMNDPENAAERAQIDVKFMIRGGDKPNPRAPKPTPFVLGTVVLDESLAQVMLSRSKGKTVKSALEMVFSGPFGGSVGLGKWTGAAIGAGGGQKK